MPNSLLLATILVLTALAFNLNLATSSRVLGTCRANGHVGLQSKATTGYCSSKSISNCCEDRKTYFRFHCSPPVKRSTPAIMTFNSFTSHGRVGGPSVNPKSKHHYFRPISRTHKVTTFDSTSQYGNRFGTLVRNRSNTTQDGHRFGSLDRNRFNTTQDGRRHNVVTSNNVPKHGNKIHQRGTAKCDNKYHGNNELVVALSTGWYNGGSRCLKNIRIKGHGKSVVAKVVDECDSVNGCDSQRGFRVPCGNNVVDASPAVWKALGIPKGKIGNYKITWSEV